MRFLWLILIGVGIALSSVDTAKAQSMSTGARETAKFILKKFGRGAGGESIEEITKATGAAVVKYGDDALPLLQKSGHAGFSALEQAGPKAPDVIKLFASRGDESIWVISNPKKLAIFIHHGDSAADALLKHPGIADDLIGRFGKDAVGAMNSVSRQSAQRLSMIADDGLLSGTSRGPELLTVVRKHGDEAMDFIWKHKKSLAVASVLTTFLDDPQAYISATKQLIIDPLAAPIIKSIRWTLVILGILAVVFLPFIAKSAIKARSIWKGKSP